MWNFGHFCLRRLLGGRIFAIALSPAWIARSRLNGTIWSLGPPNGVGRKPTFPLKPYPSPPRYVAHFHFTSILSSPLRIPGISGSRTLSI